MKTIKILHTSDTHGYVYPYAYSDNKVIGYGLARISTLIKSNKDDSTLLVDTGDTLQGSALTYYHSLNYKDNPSPISDIFNEIGYDYVTVGNHDFNYGQEYLLNYSRNLNATLLSNNTYKYNDLLFTPYEIREIDGIKVGIIGVTTQHIPFWENPDNIRGISFVHAYDATKATVTKIRNQVNAIVIAYHGGFESDIETGESIKNETGENAGYKILTEIDGVDVVLSGHQHRVLSGVKNGVAFTQPGANGTYVGEVILEFDNNNNLVNSSSKLLDVSHYNPDEVILNIHQKLEDETQIWLDEELGRLENGDLLITDPLEDRIHKHPLVEFINTVQMKVSNATISCTSLGNTVKGFEKVITMRDVISTYVYPNTLAVLEMDGHTLKKALEKCAEFFIVDDDEIVFNKLYLDPKLELYNYDMYDGIEYEINLSNPMGERITYIRINGNDIDLESSFEVVMNNYRASGGGNFNMLEDAKIVKTIEQDVVDIIASYIIENKVIHLQGNENIKIVK